jgi:hypothetical protein
MKPWKKNMFSLRPSMRVEWHGDGLSVTLTRKLALPVARARPLTNITPVSTQPAKRAQTKNTIALHAFPSANLKPKPQLYIMLHVISCAISFAMKATLAGTFEEPHPLMQGVYLSSSLSTSSASTFEAVATSVASFALLFKVKVSKVLSMSCRLKLQ